MNRIIRFVVLAACAALLAPAARADTQPGLPNVIVPQHITIVGHTLGVPDAGGQFGVKIMDLAGLPIAGSIVFLDFSNAPDVRLATDVVAPGSIVDCPTRTIRTVTGADGWAHFTIVGASTGVAAQCVAGSWCDRNVRIYADGVWLAQIGASLFDLDESSGVAGGDLALWLTDFATGLHPMRSDHDGDGSVGGADLALWLARFGAGGSEESGASHCP